VWQIYFGIIFIGIVMYAPGGIAGLIMMHRPLARGGTLHMLVPAYLIAALPTLALACGVILLIEIVSRYIVHADADTTVHLFGIPLDTSEPLTWGIALVLSIGGFVVARMTWRRIVAAWDRAATAARDKGHMA
jgi:branched-chain amino acid transport system permease protein